MSQRDRALEIVRRDVLPLAFGADPGEPAVVRLRRIVAESQNEPPHGLADGSLCEAEWTAMRDLAEALEKAASLSSKLVSGALRGGPARSADDVWRDARIQWPNRWSEGW